MSGINKDKVSLFLCQPLIKIRLVYFYVNHLIIKIRLVYSKSRNAPDQVK